MTAKILQYGFYWPTMFKNMHAFSTPFISWKAKIKMERSIYCETCVSLQGLDIENPKNDNVFKVNGHRLKAYFDNFLSENESIGLNDPIYKG